MNQVLTVPLIININGEIHAILLLLYDRVSENTFKK